MANFRSSPIAALLTQAREALEHANAVARTLAQCEEFLKEAQFDKALQALDATLQQYPDDPALVTHRNEVEERQRASRSAAASRAVLEEAQRLLGEDRPDLAARLLRERVAESSDRVLLSRLEWVEALAALGKESGTKGALQRTAAPRATGTVAVGSTILEEALELCPESEELAIATRRVRDRFDDREREKRLARRLKLIRDRIASRSWRTALALLDDTQNEFPRAPNWIRSGAKWMPA